MTPFCQNRTYTKHTREVNNYSPPTEFFIQPTQMTPGR
jgi:hypothetical protein